MNNYERLSQEFVDDMAKNMWTFMNEDMINHILKSATCDIGFTYKKRVDDDDFDDSYRNTICMKGPRKEGHYVFIDNEGEVWGTYEMKLISSKDDGICHGGAILAAMNQCGYEIAKLTPLPKSVRSRNGNYRSILKLYEFIIEKGWWDKALKKYWYNDVNWTQGEPMCKETKEALHLLKHYKLMTK